MHLSSSPVFSGIRVTRSLVFCVSFVDRCLSFWSLCCVFLQYTDSDYLPLVSSNSSYTTHSLKTNEKSWIYSITCIQKFKNSRKRLCFNASADFYSSYNFFVVLCLVNCCYAFYSSWIQIFMCQLTVVYSSKLILLWWLDVHRRICTMWMNMRK